MRVKLSFKILSLILLVSFFYLLVTYLTERRVKRLLETELAHHINNLARISVQGALDALRKGNMVNFSHILETIALEKSVKEFALTDRNGRVLYSSKKESVGKNYERLIKGGGGADEIVAVIPVETTRYCVRCHTGWKVGSVDSYFVMIYSKDILKKFAAISRQKTVLMGISVVLAVVLGLLFYYFSIGRPMKKLFEGIQRISSGELGYRFRLKSGDEMEEMAENLNRLVERLSENLLQVAEQAKMVGEMTASVVSETEKIRSEAERQRDLSEKTKESAVRLVKVRDDTVKAEEAIEKVYELASSGESLLKEVQEKVEKTSSTIESVWGDISKLHELSKEIGKISETIRDIATHTNLLALNATIEAARAGEAGKGFAVVANEVKELSKQTEEATSEIENLIKEISINVERSVQSMQETVEDSRTEKEKIEEVYRFFQEIFSEIHTLSETMKATRAVVEEVAEGIEREISEIYQGATKNVEVIASLKKVSDELSSMVSRLEVLIERARSL